jgi:hypothetical protein
VGDGEAEFRTFLKRYPETCLNVVVFAAFGFRNNAEELAGALLKAYNEREEREKCCNQKTLNYAVNTVYTESTSKTENGNISNRI